MQPAARPAPKATGCAVWTEASSRSRSPLPRAARKHCKRRATQPRDHGRRDGIGPVLAGCRRGGTRGALWTQIVSDVTGRSQELSRENIGASYGDALLAAIGIGAADSATQWNETSAVVVPNPVHTARYDSLYGIYGDLYSATKEQAHKLADLQAPSAVQ